MFENRISTVSCQNIQSFDQCTNPWSKYVRGSMVCTIYYGVGLTKESSKAQKADKRGKILNF